MELLEVEVEPCFLEMIDQQDFSRGRMSCFNIPQAKSGGLWGHVKSINPSVSPSPSFHIEPQREGAHMRFSTGRRQGWDIV